MDNIELSRYRLARAERNAYCCKRIIHAFPVSSCNKGRDPAGRNCKRWISLENTNHEIAQEPVSGNIGEEEDSHLETLSKTPAIDTRRCVLYFAERAIEDCSPVTDRERKEQMRFVEGS